MKKVYERPEIIFECFSLSTSIAGDCEVKTNTPSQGNCGVNLVGVGNVFMSGMDGCSDFPVDNGQFNEICYHVPTEANNLFNS